MVDTPIGKFQLEFIIEAFPKAVCIVNATSTIFCDPDHPQTHISVYIIEAPSGQDFSGDPGIQDPRISLKLTQKP